MFRKPCVHRKLFWGLPSPPWNDCNGEFQEGGDGLQEEPQLHHWSNMEIPKVGDLVKWTESWLWSLPHVSLCFYWIFTGSLNSWTTCLGRTCGTTTSTGPPTSRSALPATSTSHLLVCHFLFLLPLSLFLVSGHFETLSWDLHLLANKTGLPQWDDKRVSDIIFKITIEQNQHFHPFQEIVQYATHQKVSEEYYATVEKEAIRKLYKRWVFLSEN